jgi:excisionase family DNA binding protein
MKEAAATREAMITIAEVATMCNVTERTIRALVAKKKIPHRKLGTGKKPPVRFYPSEVQAWIDTHGVKLEAEGE